MKKAMLPALLLATTLLLSACAPAPAPAPSPTPVAEQAGQAPSADPAGADPAHSQEPAMKAEYRKMSVADAKARMDSGDDLIILDVRTKGEYDEGHIPGAVLLPNESIGKEQPAQLPDLHQEILLYCRSGNRSRQAAQKLVAMGYTNVHDFGGIISWPYEIVKD